MKRALSISVSFAALLGLGACSSVGGTTYGTGVSQEAQLLEDLGGVVSLGSRKTPPPIDYSVRPELIKPASRQNLPAPVDGTAVTDNPNWPVDPETRRQQLRESLAKAESGSYVLTPDEEAERQRLVLSRKQYLAQKRARLRQEIKSAGLGVDEQGTPTRRYLTEPPVEYRQPAPTAPVGELGIPEDKKRPQKPKDSVLSRMNPFK